MADDFRTRYREAVANTQLGANLLRFQRGWRETRDARMAVDADPGVDFAATRHALAAAKDNVIAHHPEHLERFVAAAERNGMTIHRAATADAAVAVVASICRERGATRIIKTKSMVSEEIHLNHGLAQQGIDAVETDVGEWIIQLRHETPAHMVMPAIHLNRRQVAATLRDATREPVPDDDVGEQVATVRRTLRPALLDTRVGLTGANALVADTGTVVILTNEGNESLLTAAVDTQVVLVGTEKVVPTMADLVAQLRLLARSATGQVITTYTTLITAPHDGQEIHVVLLDNGRSAMRDDPEVRDALRCIRCAACASVCPPYQAVGGSVFGYIYSGAIGLVNTAFHNGLEHAAGPQSLCVSCNACQEVCPVDIPLPRQILAVRRRVVEAQGLGAGKRLAFALWAHPRAFRAAADIAAFVSAPLRNGRRVRVPCPRRQRWRTVPALSLRTARRRIAPSVPGATDGPLAQSAARGQRVAFFIQCITDRLSPGIATDAVEVIRACGADVVVPRAQHCCGLPMFDSGDWNAARRLARQTIATLESANADWIVSTANSCVAAIVHEYPDLLRGDAEWSARAARVAARTIDMATFLTEVAQLPDGALSIGPAEPDIHTYHPFCQSRRILHVDDRARRVLVGICGVTLAALDEESVCCGFGGSTSITAPEVGHAIVERKLGNIDATGAGVVISDNPGCLLHIQSAADASGRSLRAAHLVEVVAERLRRMTSAAKVGAGQPGSPTPGSAQKRA